MLSQTIFSYLNCIIQFPSLVSIMYYFSNFVFNIRADNEGLSEQKRLEGLISR